MHGKYFYMENICERVQWQKFIDKIYRQKESTR